MPEVFVNVTGVGGAVKQYGPFENNEQAEAYGLPFAEEGHHVELERVDKICDFCCMEGVEIKYRYPCRTFVAQGVPWGSVGDWAACQVCHDLIEAGDKEGLVERSVESFAANHPGFPMQISHVRRVVTNEMRELHTMFYRLRTGDAQKL